LIDVELLKFISLIIFLLLMKLKEPYSFIKTYDKNDIIYFELCIAAKIL